VPVHEAKVANITEQLFGGQWYSRRLHRPDEGRHRTEVEKHFGALRIAGAGSNPMIAFFRAHTLVEQFAIRRISLECARLSVSDPFTLRRWFRYEMFGGSAPAQVCPWLPAVAAHEPSPAL